jgi:hypothetical protein
VACGSSRPSRENTRRYERTVRRCHLRRGFRGEHVGHHPGLQKPRSRPSTPARIPVLPWRIHRAAHLPNDQDHGGRFGVPEFKTEFKLRQNRDFGGKPHPA